LVVLSTPAVVIDVATLTTLPEREFKAGLAEVIKYGLLVGGEFLTQLQTALKKALLLIALNCLI